MKGIMKIIIGGAVLSSIAITAKAVPIAQYYEIYAMSTTGYTQYILKNHTGSNAVCNNEYITGADSHSAILVNSEDHVRSPKVLVMEGKREELDVSKIPNPTNYDTTRAEQGHSYRQRHEVWNRGVITKGTFSVDNKKDYF